MQSNTRSIHSIGNQTMCAVAATHCCSGRVVVNPMEGLVHRRLACVDLGLSQALRMRRADAGPSQSINEKRSLRRAGAGNQKFVPADVTISVRAVQHTLLLPCRRVVRLSRYRCVQQCRPFFDKRCRRRWCERQLKSKLNNALCKTVQNKSKTNRRLSQSTNNVQWIKRSPEPCFLSVCRRRAKFKDTCACMRGRCMLGLVHTPPWRRGQKWLPTPPSADLRPHKCTHDQCQARSQAHSARNYMQQTLMGSQCILFKCAVWADVTVCSVLPPVQHAKLG